MTPGELSERLWQFVARVGKVVDALPDTRLGRHVAGQLVRCGTATPPNYDEGCATFYCYLALAVPKRVGSLQGECHELSKILARSILTAKSSRTSAGLLAQPR
jgi:hypothetical protein